MAARPLSRLPLRHAYPMCGSLMERVRARTEEPLVLSVSTTGAQRSAGFSSAGLPDRKNLVCVETS